MVLGKRCARDAGAGVWREGTEGWVGARGLVAEVREALQTMEVWGAFAGGVTGNQCLQMSHGNSVNAGYHCSAFE